MTDITFATHMRSPQFIYTYDSVVSGVMCIAFVFGASTIADLAGWPAAAPMVTILGAFLLSWALFNYALGTARAPARSAVLTNIAGDGLWFGASLVMLVMHGSMLNTLGQVLIVGQALFVLAVFVIKVRGYKALEMA